MKTSSKVMVTLAASMLCAAPVFAGDSEQPVSDTVITTKVKAELAKDSQTSATAIHVETKNGVVYLTGNVASDVEREKASKNAQMVKGVSTVKNELKVGK